MDLTPVKDHSAREPSIETPLVSIRPLREVSLREQLSGVEGQGMAKPGAKEEGLWVGGGRCVQ